MKCERHPSVETNLLCGKCLQPVCPRCLIQTPVGVRCKTCAGMKRLPVYSIPWTFYLRAIGAGLSAGAVLGVIWSFLSFGGLFMILIGAGAGYAVAEAISLSVNRKRGPGLQIIGIAGMMLSFLVRGMLVAPFPTLGAYIGLYALISLALGILIASSKLQRN